MANRLIGELRPQQLITTFGPGSITDGKNDSIVVLDCDYWPSEGKTIKDPRLSKYMGVFDFKTPGQKHWGVPAISFPDYHVCSNKKCNSLFKLSDSINLDKYTKQGPKCPKCGGTFDAYPSRFIVYCEDGHMDDFPWMDWVHDNEGHSCKGDSLTITSLGFSSSLADIRVTCNECKKSKTMAGVLNKKAFEAYSCNGKHPHRPKEKFKSCKKHKQWIPSLRGASNVYFSVIKSAISIPPWINPIDNLIDDNYKLLLEYEEDWGQAGLEKVYNKNFAPKYTFEEFNSAYQRRKEKINTYLNLKEMEYKAITNFKDVDNLKNERIFKAKEEELPNYLKKYFSRLIRLERLREVMVLTGFMRDSFPEPDFEEQEGIVELTKHKDNWLPAVEMFGEGIFIEFNKDTLEHFFSSKELKRVKDDYKELYDKFISQKGWEHQVERNGVYVLLHTFSHLLINQLAGTSGYSSTALKERIYFSDEMCGLLIYTGTADSEGTLGGLVEMGKKDNFTETLTKALENALDCSADPICSSNKPNSEDNRLNGAACHACSMISETSCETGNRFLDRSLLVSLNGINRPGYFDELVRVLCKIGN